MKVSQRGLLTVCLLLFLSASAWAQPPLEDFHRALEAYQFEEASLLLEKLPKSPAKDLLTAELHVSSGRPDLSYNFTDALDVSTVPTELQAKYFLVRAQQEQTTSHELTKDTEYAVEAMIREGLHAPGSSHDRASLLLLKIERASPVELDAAQKVYGELIDLPNLDSKFSLRAQVTLAVLRGRPAEAVNLWSSLSETADLKGQKRAAKVYALKALKLQDSPDKRQNSLRSAREILTQSLAAKDRFAVLQSWKTLEGLSGPQDSETVLTLGLEAVSRMEDSVEKLELLYELVPHSPSRSDLLEKGVTIARKIGEPLIEASFLNRLSFELPFETEGEALRTQARALLTAESVRGTSGMWFGDAAWLLTYRPWTLAKTEKSVENLAKALDALDPAAGPMKQLELYRDFSFAAYFKVNADLFRATFFPAIDLALSLPDIDRVAALRVAGGLNSPSSSWADLGRPPDKRAEWQEALTTALLTELSSRKDTVDRILEAGLWELKHGRGDKSAAYANLAGWLAAFGRRAEAKDLLRLAISVSDPESQSSYQEKLGSLLVGEGDAKGLELLTQRVPGLLDSTPQRIARVGWLALSLGRPLEAEKYARTSLGERSEESDAYAAPRLLLASALSQQSRTEDALAVLDQVTSEDPSHILTRAEIQLNADRVSDAAATLSALKIEPIPSMSAYEWRLRREIAKRANDQKTLDTLETELAAFLALPSSLPHDSLYAGLWRRVTTAPLDYTETLERPTSSSFADLVEGLERLRRREPDILGLKQVSAADLRKLQMGAEGDEVFVKPVLLETSVVLICVTSDEASLVEVFCDRPKLVRTVTSFTDSLSSPQSTLSAGEMDGLYLSQRLVAPWRTRFPSRSRVRWLGEGVLRKLPLSVLPDERGTPLLNRLAVTYLDGPEVHEAKLSQDPATLLVAGASDLPGATAELEAVRRLFPKGQSWRLGDPMADLKALTPLHQLVHISTHGQAPSSKKLGASLVGDGQVLTSFDLAELRFNKGALAVLGTCESYVDAETGRDNSSLVSALRTAGADVVVGSLWELDDEVTAQLFTRFYQELKAGKTADRALAAAQHAVREKNPHPYYWAGLQVVSGR